MNMLARRSEMLAIADRRLRGGRPTIADIGEVGHATAF